MKLYQHTLYPGYYICLKKRIVYSIKSGELKPLKKNFKYTTGYMDRTQIGYTMSYKGVSKFLNIDDLEHYCDFTERQKDLNIAISLYK